ncbi:MAG: WYL domain-containing protein [Actinobacteria bacterium]|nr:WYL domain-containing protein [Actinomycetota bacterium]
MPDEQKLDDSDRFNLMLALTGLLVQGEEYEIKDLVKHFGVSKSEIIKAVKMISFTDLMNFNDFGHYLVDYDDLEDGYVSIRYDFSNAVDEVPRLSSRQASALAAGLVYLSSLPGLVDNSEIEELQNILASGDSRGAAPEMIIKPGSRDADLAKIREAISKNVAITCDYLNQRGITTLGRLIEPLRIDPHGETIYLRGWCPESLEVKSFRVDRMRNTHSTEIPISKEAREAELSDDIYSPAESDTIVTIEVDPEAYSLIFDFKPVEEPESLSSFRKRFKIKVGDVRNMGRIIARFGGAARVIAPESARQAVREFALSAIGQGSLKSPKNVE